jgi:CheY-like chemotaxis protein
VLRAGERAKNLVKQILTFSRQAQQEREPVQMRPIVKEALKFLRASLPASIEIRQDIQSDAPVMADPTQLYQVIMNLCTNAGHAMRENGGVLEVTLSDVDVGTDWLDDHPELRPGTYQELRVSDTGHGIPAQIMDRIFDPFFTTKKTGEGTGMGLSVVHGIVSSYAGAIKANSQQGNGSTFSVYLPVIDRQLKHPTVAVEPVPTGTERILFVDDEPALAEIGKRILDRLGYYVITQTSSLDALAWFKANPDKIDLVITDMSMPHMSGDKLSAELMRVRPQIPVILCTGYHSTISDESARKIGIKAFTYKPIAMNDLAKTIRSVLDEAKAVD